MRRSPSRVFAAAAFVAVSLLSGCAANVKRADTETPLVIDAAARKNVAVVFDGSDTVRKSADWEALKGAWRGAFNTHAAANDTRVTFPETAPKSVTTPTTVVTIHVEDYRYLSAGARFGFGIMTGNAYLNSKVVFSDGRTGKRYGERAFNTSSSAWEGVFSAMTDKQLDAITREIFADLRGQ